MLDKKDEATTNKWHLLLVLLHSFHQIFVWETLALVMIWLQYEVQYKYLYHSLLVLSNYYVQYTTYTTTAAVV